MRVYLAGKMGGLTKEEMMGWRNKATEYLNENGVLVLDPCKTGPMKDSKEIVSSNKFMINHCDLVLAEIDYLVPSIGTICEIVYATNKGIPVVGWGRATDIFRHPWIEDMVTVGFYNIEGALSYIIKNYTLPEVQHA